MRGRRWPCRPDPATGLAVGCPPLAPRDRASGRRCTPQHAGQLLGEHVFLPTGSPLWVRKNWKERLLVTDWESGLRGFGLTVPTGREEFTTKAQACVLQEVFLSNPGCEGAQPRRLPTAGGGGTKHRQVLGPALSSALAAVTRQACRAAVPTNRSHNLSPSQTETVPVRHIPCPWLRVPAILSGPLNVMALGPSRERTRAGFVLQGLACPDVLAGVRIALPFRLRDTPLCARPRPVHPFACGRTLGLFPPLGGWERCSCEHGGVSNPQQAESRETSEELALSHPEPLKERGTQEGRGELGHTC